MSRIPPAPRDRQAFSVIQSGQDAIDLALWQVLRDVVLWASTPPENRARLFRVPSTLVRDRIEAAAEAVPLLADPLALLSRIRIIPNEISAEAVAIACDHVYDWADRGGLHDVAVHFAEASAYAAPMNPRWAVRAGYMTRTAGGVEMMMRSDEWHARAFVLAIHARDREMALRALTGRGALHKERGDYVQARRLYLQAARRAERSGRKRRAAVALHYAFALAAERGQFREAVRDANAAIRNYPLHDERIPALAHDVAYLLIRHQHYTTALYMVDRLGERVSGVASMGMLYGMAARAAAGAGNRGSYRVAAEMAFNIAQINEECAGGVYVHLAEAARSWGRWEECAEHAQRALAVARKRADTEIEPLAVELVRQADVREVPPPDCTPDPDTPIAALARRLAARLRRWRRYTRSVGINA
jgi:tetratricopeptide (TPR) repeat protein